MMSRNIDSETGERYGFNRHRSHHLRRAGKPGKSGRCMLCHFSGCQCISGIKTVKVIEGNATYGYVGETPRVFKWSGFKDLRKELNA